MNALPSLQTTALVSVTAAATLLLMQACGGDFSPGDEMVFTRVWINGRS